MSQIIFAVLVLLPSVAFCFVALSTLYGAVKAYTAISWIPIVLYLFLSGFNQMEYAQKVHAANLSMLLEAVGMPVMIYD